MAYATAEDVRVRLGRTLSGPENETAATLLEDAENILVAGLPTIPDAVAADPDYRALVVMVESAMVTRVLRNPGGYRTIAEGGAVSQVDTRAAAGFLVVLDDEWELLGGKRSARVFSIAPGFPGAPLLTPPEPWG